MSDFYAVGPLTEVAISLFHGWGYNFYRTENQLRADDQLVRSKVGQLLGFAHADVVRAEAAYRRDQIPAPTRAKPFPDPDALVAVQMLERIAREISALIGRVQAQPVPANDRMSQRYRNEAQTLAALQQHDTILVGQAALLRSSLDKLDGRAILAQHEELERGLAAIGKTLEQRALEMNAVTR